MKYILYPKTDNKIALIVPTGELPIYAVINKDIPTGKPYKIIDSSSYDLSRMFFGAYEMYTVSVSGNTILTDLSGKPIVIDITVTPTLTSNTTTRGMSGLVLSGISTMFKTPSSNPIRTDSVITLNVNTVKEIQIDRWRSKRSEILPALDVQMLRAIEVNDTVKIAEIAANKQALRDVTLTPLTGTTVQSISAVWPSILNEIV